jgi:hypothetical protein
MDYKCTEKCDCAQKSNIYVAQYSQNNNNDTNKNNSTNNKYTQQKTLQLHITFLHKKIIPLFKISQLVAAKHDGKYKPKVNTFLF